MSSDGVEKLVPRSTSSVRKAVSNVRNADASVRARIHFAEEPENEYLQKLIAGIPGTAVTWDVRGLRPHGAFQLYVREFGDLRRGSLSIGNTITEVFTMKHIVICAGESGWRYRTKEEEDSGQCRDSPVIFADGDGKAQGVSIERNLRVQDVIGRMIVIQEVQLEVQNATRETIPKRGPALGVIGCQCVKVY